MALVGLQMVVARGEIRKSENRPAHGGGEFTAAVADRLRTGE
jgi:hypothetical protein